MIYLVIMLWMGNPADWHTYRVPMRDFAECRRAQLAYFYTPDKDKPQGVLIHCEHEDGMPATGDRK